MLNHAIGVNSQAGLACQPLLEMREDVHLGGVPPDKKWLVCFLCTLHEVERFGVHFLVDRFHSLLVERACVGDAAIGKAVDHAAWAKLLFELRIGWVVGVLRFFLGIQVVEVAVELVEAVGRGQHVIPIAQVIFSKLTRRVPTGPQQRGNRGILFLHAFWRAREAHLRESGSNRRLPRDEGSPTSRATLLPIPIRKERPFAGDAIDVGRFVTHHAKVVGTHVELADVVSPDHENVGPLEGLCLGCERTLTAG